MWLLFSITSLHAQANLTGKLTAEPSSLLLNSEFYLTGGAILVLLFIILGLTRTSVSLSKVVSQVNKKSSATILLLLLSAAAFSQTDVAEAKPSNTLPEWLFIPDMYAYAFLLFIMIIAVVVLYRINMRLIRIMSPKAFEKESVAEAEVAVAEKKPAFFRRIYLRLVDSVPVEQERDVLLDHDYDGIKELDNNLPPWWKYGFYFTIVYAVFYLFIYHVSGIGKLPLEEYKDELLLAEKQKEERMKLNAENVNEENVVALTEVNVIAMGKETFTKLCVTCHRADGGGQVGPNLTDDYWLHGGGIKNIFKTITYGVPNKGMISWQSQLSPKQIQTVASYILTLKGTNPPGPKEPQGDKWIEENVTLPDSITKAKNDSSIVAAANKLKK